MIEAKIIECPRDAWQGLPKIIPTDVKAEYLRGLLLAGFRHIDAVSFVSPKYVPQMADSESVMEIVGEREAERLRQAEIIGIVVNERGFRRALASPGVSTIGYPYSISEHFMRQNANMSQEESRRLVEEMQRTMARSGVGSAGGSEESGGSHSDAPRRGLVIYISMAFGNPYGDPSSPEMVTETLEWLDRIGVRAVSLADTVGKAQPQEVGELFRAVKDFAARMEIGVHLHSRPAGAAEKILAAYEAGCRRFDSALTGLGGCPFAGDELVGNIPTEIVVNTLAGRGVDCGIEPERLQQALQAAEEIRAQYAE